MIANYHTHTWRCRHADGTEREYVENAIAAGLKILGFSDHTPQVYPNGFVCPVKMLPEELEGYVDTILDLKREYKADIDILLGLEAEYLYTLWEPLLRLRPLKRRHRILKLRCRLLMTHRTLTPRCSRLTLPLRLPGPSQPLRRSRIPGHPKR